MAFSPSLLEGKVGIVTGAGSPYGIGRSLVLALAAAGARAVYATDITLANIPSLKKEVDNMGSTCAIHGSILDVTSEEQTVGVVKSVLAEYGRFDFFFANAGVGFYKTLQEMDTAHYDRTISILQRSFFLAIKYGGHAMCEVSAEKTSPGGTIIATSSMAGVTGAVSDISYSTAKAAVSNMVKSASVQLSASNVRVNAIAPGFVRTSIASTSAWIAGGHQDKDLQTNEADAVQQFDAIIGAAQSSNPSKYYYNRVPEPVEIANIGVFLASNLSASINGQNIVADSGKTVAALGETVIGPVEPLTPLTKSVY